MTTLSVAPALLVIVYWSPQIYSYSPADLIGCRCLFFRRFSSSLSTSASEGSDSITGVKAGRVPLRSIRAETQPRNVPAGNPCLMPLGPRMQCNLASDSLVHNSLALMGTLKSKVVLRCISTDLGPFPFPADFERFTVPVNYICKTSCASLLPCLSSYSFPP